MNKKALIIDLDNTIYPVASVGEELFRPLFKCIVANGHFGDRMEEIKNDVMRRPFQQVADSFGFGEQLKLECLTLLKDLTYNGKMNTYPDYIHLLNMPQLKYLVTTGFTRLQHSKISLLGIENDFKEIHVSDPVISKSTKKDIMLDIISRHEYATSELLVIGDDLHSEIKAANDVGIDSVLYDKTGIYSENIHPAKINDFGQLGYYL